MNALSTTFYELLADNLSVRPDQAALIDGNRTTTYRELHDTVVLLAGALTRQGVLPGERVVVHLRKGLAEVAALFAVARVGAVAVNVNIQWSMEQLAYVVADCRPKALLLAARSARAWAQAGAPGGASAIVVDDAGRPDGATGGNGAAVRTLDSQLAMILYTSGSTGRPKGVMLSHHNIVLGARSVARYLKLDATDRLLSVLPYSFDYGLNQLTTMMLVGGTVVHQPVAMAAEIVQAAATHQVTGIAGVPPLWHQIVRLLVERPTTLPHLRRVTNSGGKIAPNTLERMPEVFPGAEVFLMYGLTEAFRSTYLAPQLLCQKMGAIGRAIPGAEVYVVRHGVGLAAPGEEGELVHRGPLVSMGYWERPEATAEKIRPCPELAHLIGNEPVAYSGDIVRIDEDGDLWFVGRNDAMIKTSGFRLSPDEVEAGLSRCGLVGDVVAFGVPDDHLGQAVHVALSPLEGFDEAAVLRHCRQTLPHYMLPQRLHVWHEPMPRTASGKLDRPAIVRASQPAANPAPAGS